MIILDLSEYDIAYDMDQDPDTLTDSDQRRIA